MLVVLSSTGGINKFPSEAGSCLLFFLWCLNLEALLDTPVCSVICFHLHKRYAYCEWTHSFLCSSLLFLNEAVPRRIAPTSQLPAYAKLNENPQLWGYHLGDLLTGSTPSGLPATGFRRMYCTTLPTAISALRHSWQGKLHLLVTPSSNTLFLTHLSHGPESVKWLCRVITLIY